MADSLKNSRPHTATSKDKKGKTTKASNANLKILMDTLSLLVVRLFLLTLNVYGQTGCGEAD